MEKTATGSMEIEGEGSVGYATAKSENSEFLNVI